MAERGRVVVRQAAPRVPVGGNLVPFLARDFARLAADAQRGVGQEGRDRHQVCLLNSIYLVAASPRGRRPGMRSHSSAFDSMIRTFGSSEIATRSLTASPVTMPRDPK